MIALAFLTTTDGALLPLRFYTFITHALLHFNLPHILFNSIAILTAGTVACRFLGTARFLALVTACAIAGAAAHVLLNWGEAYALGGASGVAFGMWGAGAYFWVYRSHETMRVRVGKVAYYVVLMMGLNFLYAYAVSGSGAFGMTGDVSWEAHAGGFLTGFLLFPLLRPRQPANG